jgi:hypothetical protein
MGELLLGSVQNKQNYMSNSKTKDSVWKRAGRQVLEYLRVYSNNRRDPLFREWYYKYRSGINQFRNCHKGEDCFIIGNGPSLKDMNLSPLKRHHTFGLNKIYLMSERGVDLNLSYLVSVNPLVIEQSAEVFEGIDCETFLSYSAAHDQVRPFKHVNYVYTRGAPYTFRGDLNQRIHEGHTVTFVAMQIAYFMGFRRVFLVGVDHSFQAEGDPNETQRMDSEDVNHFDPDYFRGNDWQLPDLKASELSYHLARFFYRRDGRQILDATVDGELDIFPKASYEEALEQCSAKI